jgi:phytoene synthase
MELLPLLDRASAASVATMAAAYRRLLRRIEREPGAVLTRRVSLPSWEKGWVAARSLVGAAR